MRAVIQRVKHTSLCVGGALVSEIPGGLAVYLGVAPSDTQQNAAAMAKKIAAQLQKEAGAPRVGFILGSGWGDAVHLDGERAVAFSSLEGMPACTVAGHAGNFLFGKAGGNSAVISQGRLHLYEGHAAATAVLPVAVLYELGVRTVVLTNAAGGIDPAMQPGELMITADTIVWLDGRVLGKPKDREDALQMLRDMSGRTHEVFTGVCITTTDWQRSFAAQTEVCFAQLTEEEITYYVDRYQPMDKAGSYGVQEWIGFIGVENISGSYFNIMGLPVQRLYRELKAIV